MNLCVFLIIIYIFKANGSQGWDLLNYDDVFNKNNFRKTFIANKRDHELKNKRANFLDKYLFNNTVYLDGIIHYETNENNTNISKIKKIEKEFRTILAMRGVKYMYKRGSKWRTWREIMLRDGGKKIVCYVCENIVKDNCTNCHSGGYWTIEDKPQCPYELFSIKNDNQICGKNYTAYSNVENDCSSDLKFEDLGASCDNPIETKWRIRRDYKHLTSHPVYICNGRDYCDVTTIYTIDAQGISFRIINSSNIIFYSRVMRNGERNYACIDDCGYWEPNTKKINTQPNPITFNLLGKKKRENILSTTDISTKNWKSTKIKNKLKNVHGTDKSCASMVNKNAGNIVDSTMVSLCERLKNTEDEEYDEEISE